LSSVFSAIKNLEAEVWVVDNNSVDGSVPMVKEQFPQAKLIANKDNVGFSKANNQAIKKANGEYVLLLNPDTVVEEDTFEKVVKFMDSHPKAGGLGVKMIDGKGNYLPESKRGIPTPEVSFYKIFGLTRLFPKSKKFAKYYMGHIDKEKTAQVEILSGAFMMLRKKVLDEIGLLDETFFMYGEDIDLSYRILKAGYENYYFADTTIVHYKGESTKKGSLNYVYVFYNAMMIFVQKHFAKQNAKLFLLMIKFAIVFRAFLSIIKRIFQKIYLPLIDGLVIFAGFYFFVPFWESIHLGQARYPDFIWYMIPAYIMIWLITSYYTGVYDVPVKLKSILNGIGLGTIMILLVYALIDVKFRFSRLLILWGAGFAITEMLLIRFILYLFRSKTNYRIFSKAKRKIIIVGSLQEANRVSEILNKISANIDILGYINPYPEIVNEKNFIGNIDKINEIIKILRVNEVVFCAKDLKMRDIISMMLSLSGINVNVKIAPEDSISIIGSNSINTSGELYVLELNAITNVENRRMKNLIDKLTSILFLIFYPVLFFFVRRKLGFLKNIFKVLLGQLSWVGFSSTQNKLPSIKKGVLTPLDTIDQKDSLSEVLIQNINASYARNYNYQNDLFIIFKGIKELGRKVD